MRDQTTNRRTALIVSSTAHVVQDGLSAAIYVLLPLLAQAFGFTYAEVGLFKGVKSLAQGILEMSSGILSERVGDVRTLVFGLVCAGIGFSMLATASQAAVAVLCLLVVGVGTAFQHAPASAIVTTAFAAGGRRGALGLYNASGDVGKLVFSGAFSLAIGAGLAWQHIAISYGLTAMMAAVGIALVIWGFVVAHRQRRPSRGRGSRRIRPAGESCTDDPIACCWWPSFSTTWCKLARWSLWRFSCWQRAFRSTRARWRRCSSWPAACSARRGAATLRSGSESGRPLCLLRL
ncbi:MAG: MFS transporter [Propylenella sp.]